MKFRFSNVSKRFLSEDTMLKYYGDSITLRRPFLFKFRRNFHSLRVSVEMIKSGDHRGNYLLLAPKKIMKGISIVYSVAVLTWYVKVTIITYLTMLRHLLDSVFFNINSYTVVILISTMVVNCLRPGNTSFLDQIIVLLSWLLHWLF